MNFPMPFSGIVVTMDVTTEELEKIQVHFNNSCGTHHRHNYAVEMDIYSKTNKDARIYTSRLGSECMFTALGLGKKEGQSS